MAELPLDILLAARARRKGRVGARRVQLTDPVAFPQQHDFIHDPHRFKALLATTRSAKSYSIGLKYMEKAANQPDYNALYVGLTLGSAREIMWLDILKDIDHRHQLGAAFNETRLSVTLPGGGRFRLVGLDTDADEVLKIQGTKYDDIDIDEAASFRIDLRQMEQRVLRPRLADKAGSLTLWSTPSDITQGLFYDVTTGREPGWKVARWHAKDNPYVRDRWIADRDALIASNPLIVNTPHFKQMWEGEWCVDTENLVYKFSRARNLVPHLPQGDYMGVLGVDLGWDDATAFTVFLWNLVNRKAFIVYAQRERFMNFDVVAARIQHLVRQYNISQVVADEGGGAKQGVQTINARYGLGIVAADKKDKYVFQQLMNSDFLTERVMVVEGDATKPLVEDYEALVWDEKELAKKPPKHEEHPALHKHTHSPDSALYAWRKTHSYAATEPQVYAKGSKEEARAVRDAMVGAAQERQRRKDAESEGDPTMDFEKDFADTQTMNILESLDDVTNQ